MDVAELTEGLVAVLVHLAWIDIPLVAYWWARRRASRWTGTLTGAALGLVLATVALGFYLASWMLGTVAPALAPLVGMPAFFLRQIHAWPSQWASSLLVPATPLSIASPQYWALEILNGLVWAPVYGVLGYWLIDRPRSRRKEV